jgi:hypothetical protein
VESSRPELPHGLEDSPSDSQASESSGPSGRAVEGKAPSKCGASKRDESASEDSGASDKEQEGRAPSRTGTSLSEGSAEAIEGEIQRGNPAKRTSAALYPLVHNAHLQGPSPKRKVVHLGQVAKTRRSTGKENEGERIYRGPPSRLRVLL